MDDEEEQVSDLLVFRHAQPVAEQHADVVKGVAIRFRVSLQVPIHRLHVVDRPPFAGVMEEAQLDHRRGVALGGELFKLASLSRGGGKRAGGHHDEEKEEAE